MPTVAQLAELMVPVLKEHGVKKAIVFGSYAKGTASEKSDIDILVDSGLKGLRFVSLLEDIQNIVGKPVDLFDITHIEQDSLIDREIADTGVTVYEA